MMAPKSYHIPSPNRFDSGDDHIGNDEMFDSHPDSTAIVTCFHSLIDSHFLLISLLLIIITITFGVLYYLFTLRRLLKKIAAITDMESLQGQTVVITGASEGIGAQVAKDLAYRGARLVLLCRDVDKARRVSDDIIKKNPTADITIHHIDLSSMTSVRVCANELLNLEPRIDVLINCASVAFVPGNEPTKSIDGYELHMAINYYGHFLLTYSLHERMKQTAKQYGTFVKVINVSSIVHRCGKIHLANLNLDKTYTPLKAYSQSKLALLMASREMARQWKSSGIHVYSVDPGLSMTRSHYQNLYPTCRNILSIFGFIIGFRTNRSASERIVYCVVNKDVAKQSGYYYRNKERTNPGKQAYDDKMTQALWTHTLTVCNLV